MYQQAKDEHKEIHGLESFQEQIDVFDKMDLTTQIALLKSTLDNLADMDKLMDETIEVYLSRDLNSILALNDKYLSFIDETSAKIFTERLITSRNHRMVERMLPLLEKGDAFVAVGTLHLAGEQGIINLLRQQGYQFTAIY